MNYNNKLPDIQPKEFIEKFDEDDIEKLIPWDEYKPKDIIIIRPIYEHVSVACPICGNAILKDTSTMLTSKYKYICIHCGWSDVK